MPADPTEPEQRLLEIECEHCEETVGFFVRGDLRGQVADPFAAPMVLCPECGYRLEAVDA